MQCVEDLNDLTDDGEPVVLGSKCHPTSDVVCEYHPKAEMLVLTCAQCGMGVADIPVSTRRSVAARKKRLITPETQVVIQRMDPKGRAARRT